MFNLIEMYRRVIRKLTTVNEPLYYHANYLNAEKLLLKTYAGAKVLLDGVEVEGVIESFSGENGYIIFAPAPLRVDVCGTKAYTERVNGNVEVIINE